jgi:hypothetical protein
MLAEQSNIGRLHNNLGGIEFCQAGPSRRSTT